MTVIASTTESDSKRTMRTALTDGSGRWFDASRATCWPEARYFDGSNHISKATGQQWEHEKLFRTAGGVYVLHHWSDWQSSGPDRYEPISARAAAAWLVKNDHEPGKDLAATAAALEVQ